MLPALLTVVVLLATAALVGSDAYTAVRFVVAILAAIVAVMLSQHRLWWWIAVPAAVAILWNPVLPIQLDDWIQQLAHFIAAGLLILVALRARVPGENLRARASRR